MQRVGSNIMRRNYLSILPQWEDWVTSLNDKLGGDTGQRLAWSLLPPGTKAVLPPEDDAFIAAAIRFAARAAAAGVPAVPGVPVVPAEQMAEPQGEPA